MDLTQLFKASVKTVRLRNKTIVLADKTRILKVRTRDEFSIKANDIRYQITQLRDLLVENRGAYMRFAYHLKNSTQMSDDERNIIDKESEKIIILCNQYLCDLRAACLKENVHNKKQVLGHQLAILDILCTYMKGVYNMHIEQKESRVQHELETYKLLKLESSNYKSNGIYHTEKYSNIFDQDSASLKNDEQRNHLGNQSNLKYNNSRNLNTSQSDVAIDEDQSNKLNTEHDNLTPDDIQMLESENTQLLNDLKGLSDEVEQIEKNVVGIAKLQEIFTEKVTVQKYDIERIGHVVIGATENIRDANEQIKQSIQRNAGLRVWVLFFLIVMSFTLLFLDWYND